MHVITLIYSKRNIRTYRMRVYIFNRLVWLNMIYYAVCKMEIDIPERDIQSKSPSDCSIDLCSILWICFRLWFIVSDDERIDLKGSFFSLKNTGSHFHGGNFSSVLFVTPFHSKLVKPFLYISPILLGNIVGVDFDGSGENIITEALARIKLLSLNSILGQSTLITHDC